MNDFGHLSDYFTGVAAKRLSVVEIDEKRSNQHEINGVSELKNLFGVEKLAVTARFIYLGEDEETTLRANANMTWYDARAQHPKRTEHRLYYQSNPVMTKAAPGDLMLLARRVDGEVLVIVAKRESSPENRLLWVFSLEEQADKFSVGMMSPARDKDIDFTVRTILEDLDQVVEPAENDFLEIMRGRFGETFPYTAVFSEFARSTLPEVHAKDDPDGAMMLWFDREEFLFRTFERHIVMKQLEIGFTSVEEFITFSLSVHNRRKSRAGFAVEHHLEQVFIENGIAYTHGAITENRAKPDFLFPSITAYRNPDFPSSSLRMLGVKSSCKDRWRQVLSEAARINHKHLFTLEGGISVAQTNEMRSHKLSLVLPLRIHSTFRQEQRDQIMSLKDFLKHLTYLS